MRWKIKMDNKQSITQKGFNLIWKNETTKNTIAANDFFAMLDWQIKAFNHLKNSQFMILNAPMGSGKSWLMCILSAHKIQQDPSLRCIIAVPQTIIAPGFVNAKLLMPDGKKISWNILHNICMKQNNKGTVSSVIKWLQNGYDNTLEDRILLCTHATLTSTYRKLKTTDSLNMLNNLLLWIDEAHHIKNAATEDFNGSIISNGLGELVAYSLNHTAKKLQVGLTTASFFRGDRCSLLTNEMENKFERFNLPYDEYFKTMKHLESFSYDFVISGPDYTNAIELLTKQRKGKDIIYVPHPNSLHAGGNKYHDVEKIITKYNNIHQGNKIHTSNGLTILKNDKNSFKILDLVNENQRNSKKNFLGSSELKKNKNALDAIIALGMFKEGANWIWADRIIIVGARSSLVDVIQMIGRLFRDAKDKKHVEILHLLPFSLEQKNSDSFRENLNNFLKAIYASLILENIFNPVKIKISANKENNNDPDADKKSIHNWLSSEIPDDTIQQELIAEVGNQLINIAATNPPVLWDEYQKIIPSILKEYGINEHLDEISKQIWSMFTQKTIQMQGISVEDIDFNILQKTHPLEFLLRYTSGICNIDTFQKLREAIQGSRQWRNLDDAKKFIHPLNLASETQWRMYIAGEMLHLPTLPNDIPRAPWVAYKNSGWRGWGDFLGTGTIAPRLRKYRSYEEARDFACSLKFKKKDDWFLYVKGHFSNLLSLPQDIPATPDKIYKRKLYKEKWEGWGNFLGTGKISNQEKNKIYRTYQEAQEFVQQLKLKSCKEWRNYLNGLFPNLPSLPLDIPKKPNEIYDKFEWHKFLGYDLSKFSCSRHFWAFKKAKNFVHKLGLKTQKDWINYCAGKFPNLPAKPLEIPSNPGKKYKNEGWMGYQDWLGTNKN
jgi:superfamily II DNA or RNA helicase